MFFYCVYDTNQVGPKPCLAWGWQFRREKNSENPAHLPLNLQKLPADQSEKKISRKHVFSNISLAFTVVFTF